MKRIALILTINLSACVFDSPDEDVQYSLEAQLPIIQLLLDANGLAHLKASEVSHVLNPGDPHGQAWYIGLSRQSLTTFKFIEEVGRLGSFTTVDLRNNAIQSVPAGLRFKSWDRIWMGGNMLCDIPKEDSARLDDANVLWRDTQRCP